MSLTSIKKDFEIIKLREKLSYGSELVSMLDKMVRDLDLSDSNNKDKVRDMCSNIEMFLKQDS